MKTKSKLFLTVFILISLLGCAGTQGTLPGQLSSSRSQFDNSESLTLHPAWLDTKFAETSIKLGLYKNSKMNKEDIVLTAVVYGAHNFDRNKSLLFNIDGKILELRSIDELTDIETHSGYYGGGYKIPPSNWSSKRYMIDKEFLDRLLSANRVAVKVNLTKTYVEGMFTRSEAQKAFKKFNEEVNIRFR